jgi:membrane dipeptidase
MSNYTDHLYRAKEILARVPLIDGHNDFPYMIRGWHLGRINSPEVDINDMPIAHTDITRLKKGLVGGVFWSAYVPCPSVCANNDFSTPAHYDSLYATLQQIDLIHSITQQHSHKLGLADNSKEVWDIFNSGRVAGLIGVEGLHQIANSASVLRNFRRLGVRYITLTHDSNNLYADATNASEPAHNGLSQHGFDIVREMNRVGLIIDLSHTSVDTQKQVLSKSKAPVIFSHSSCSALTKHPRNSPDEVLDALKENGGIFMVTFLRKLTDATNPTLERVADHIQHVGDRIGYDHVGIGSDFDGTMQTASGLDDVSKFPFLFAELLRRGVDEKSLQGLAGLNLLRVMDEVDKVSETMVAKRVDILLDAIDPIWGEDIREEVRAVRNVVL